MISRFIKTHMLWVGFFAVLVPLGLLLSLQYGWLARLERTTAVAEIAALNNYLEAVSNRVEHFYEKQAWKALNVPDTLLRANKLGKVKYHFRKREVDGIKYLFVVSYTQEQWGQLLVYDPELRDEEPEPVQAVDRAIRVALAPWKTLAHQGASVKSHEIRVDQNDPDNRIILKPITEDECRIVGVAGMIVDNSYFRDELLPGALHESLPDFFDQGTKADLVVAVRDNWGRLVYGTEVGDETQQVTRRIPFIFSDWEMALGSQGETPEQLAKSNFLFNMSLSVLLALVLLGGVVLALRTASREVRLSRMKSDFVSNVSHELRTPLASIRVFGEFLRLGRVHDEEKSREYGEYIETESRRLTQLINNILDFSKIESGAKTYKFESTDMQDVVVDTLRLLDVSVRHRGFQLVFNPPRTPVPPLTIDPDAIAQALANLVDNAVKYSNGSSEITIELGKTERSAYISVRDRGVGISREEQKKIFERFHRVGTGDVHDVKGSGLGLSIVNHIVQAHGGKIKLHSEPGRGSTFAIHLPLSKETLAASAASGPDSVGRPRKT